MPNQLSKEEIDTLFTFVESKNVKYKDVQFEIVDHLASAIEEEQEREPNLNFNSALKRIYGKFPITGFAMMILAKEEALSKYWKKRFFGAFLKCFSYPKVALTLALSTIIYLVLSIGGAPAANYLYMGMGASLIIASVIICSKNFEMNGGHEKYLFTKTYVQILFAVFITIYIIPIDLFYSDGKILQETRLNSFQCWFLTFYYSLAFYLIYAFSYEFPKILKQEVQDKYAHLNIELS